MTNLRKTPLDLEQLLADAGIQADLLPSTNGMWQNLPCVKNKCVHSQRNKV
jgi:hypothetical protein